MSGVNDQGANYAAMDQQTREENEHSSYESPSDDASWYGSCRDPPISLRDAFRGMMKWLAKSFKVILWRILAFFLACVFGLGAALSSIGPYYWQRLPDLSLGFTVLLATLVMSEAILGGIREPRRIVQDQPWPFRILGYVPRVTIAAAFLGMLWMCYLATQNKEVIEMFYTSRASR